MCGAFELSVEGSLYDQVDRVQPLGAPTGGPLQRGAASYVGFLPDRPGERGTLAPQPLCLGFVSAETPGTELTLLPLAQRGHTPR
jgi:hypothetical protein